MKHPIRWILLITALAVSSAPPLRAQDSSLAPELAPLATKYKSDVDALNEAHDKAMAALRKIYFAALDSAEQKQTALGKADALKAVLEEKRAVAAADPLPPAAPSLPRDLAFHRTNYTRDVARVGRDFTQRSQQLTSVYLRALSPLEQKARAGGQKVLLDQITAEKLKIAGEPVPAAPGAPAAGISHSPGNNLLANGDFAQKKPDGTPVAWSGTHTVQTESGMSFLRVSEELGWDCASQKVECPAGVKNVTFSARVRCPNFTPTPASEDAWFGIHLVCLDENGKGIDESNGMYFTMIRKPERNWMRLGITAKIPAETKTLQAMICAKDASGTADVMDMQLQAR
jgi:hypothetical protein